MDEKWKTALGDSTPEYYATWTMPAWMKQYVNLLFLTSVEDIEQYVRDGNPGSRIRTWIDTLETLHKYGLLRDREEAEDLAERARQHRLALEGLASGIRFRLVHLGFAEADLPRQAGFKLTIEQDRVILRADIPPAWSYKSATDKGSTRSMIDVYYGILRPEYGLTMFRGNMAPADPEPYLAFEVELTVKNPKRR